MKKIMLWGILLWTAAVAFGQSGDAAKPYLGRWALFLPGGAGWLEIRQEAGYLDGDILWYGGSVVPVEHVMINGETLLISRTRKMDRQKDATGKPLRTQTITQWIECNIYNDVLAGTLYSPKDDGLGAKTTRFYGKRIADLPPAPDLAKVKYGKPVTIFNGKDLTGWTLTSATQKNGWKAENGVLVNDPVQVEGQPHVSYGNLRTVDLYQDFKLSLQVNVPKGSNSGVYLRGLYEVQVSDSYGQPLDSHNMGAVYSRITPSLAAEKPAGEWQTLEMTLCDRHTTVVLNGKTIINNQPLMGCTGGALSPDETAPGPLYLQGDHGKVLYRNIVLTPIVK